MKVIGDKNLPKEIKEHLLEKEKVHYFSYIVYKGGCLSSSSQENYYWIAISNKRLLYKAKVHEKEGSTERTIEREGILPFEKISFVEVTDIKSTSGCGSSQHYELRVGTSGGTVSIPIPTKDKGNEIRKVYMEISEHLKRDKKHKSS